MWVVGSTGLLDLEAALVPQPYLLSAPCSPLVLEANHPSRETRARMSLLLLRRSLLASRHSFHIARCKSTRVFRAIHDHVISALLLASNYVHHAWDLCILLAWFPFIKCFAVFLDVARVTMLRQKLRHSAPA